MRESVVAHPRRPDGAVPSPTVLRGAARRRRRELESMRVNGGALRPGLAWLLKKKKSTPGRTFFFLRPRKLSALILKRWMGIDRLGCRGKRSVGHSDCVRPSRVFTLLSLSFPPGHLPSPSSFRLSPLLVCRRPSTTGRAAVPSATPSPGPLPSTSIHKVYPTLPASRNGAPRTLIEDVFGSDTVTIYIPTSILYAKLSGPPPGFASVLQKIPFLLYCWEDHRFIADFELFFSFPCLSFQFLDKGELTSRRWRG